MRLRWAKVQEETSGTRDRFGAIVRTVRWLELLTIVTGEGLREWMRHSSSDGAISTEASAVIFACLAMAVFTLWAEISGHIRLTDRTSAAGIVIDSLFLTFVVSRTGGADSWFVGLFAVLVVCVAAHHGLKGALTMAGVSAMLGILAEALDSRGWPSLNPANLWRITYVMLLAWVVGELREAVDKEMEQRVRSERMRSHMESDLAAARIVQRSLLPTEIPSVPELVVAVRYEPAGAVGGDIYDFLFHGPREMGFVVADVSGHSLPAALLVAAAKAAVHDGAPFPPEKMMELVNARMLRDAAPDQFLTMVCARIDLDTGHLSVTAAGHPPPILLRADEPGEPLMATGIILGVVQRAVWKPVSMQLQPGDVLILYSDGVMERRRADGRFTGLDDWMAAIARLDRRGSVEEMADGLWALADNLGRRHDDAALIVVRFSSSHTQHNEAEVGLAYSI